MDRYKLDNIVAKASAGITTPLVNLEIIINIDWLNILCFTIFYSYNRAATKRKEQCGVVVGMSMNLIFSTLISGLCFHNFFMTKIIVFYPMLCASNMFLVRPLKSHARMLRCWLFDASFIFCFFPGFGFVPFSCCIS